jgi:membrane fusion protein, multidrug efflux system
MTVMHNQEDKKTEVPERTSSAGLQKYWWLVFVCLAAAGLYVLVIRSQSTSDKQKGGLVPLRLPVVAAAVKTKDVRVYISGIGSVVPVNTVTVKTRIDGEVMKVLYREGQVVKRGDLLVQIDPRPYEVQLTQAEGQLIKDKALLKNARVDFERYRVLLAQNSIPEQQMVTQGSLVHQYEGMVKTDQGAIDNARLQLVYSRITAPVSGRVGLRLVDQGNIVHPTDTGGLVVITQLQPITVIFPISEDDLSKVLGSLKAGGKLAVEAYDRDRQNKLATGTLLALDNQIDQSTGTVRLRAIFPNKGNELFPNQFVNARLFIDTLHGAMVVPAESIQRGPQGAFVYVVKTDKTVSMSPVSLGVMQESEAVVRAGLAPGELVVVEGTDRLREGSKVEAKIQGEVTQDDRSRLRTKKKADR